MITCVLGRRRRSSTALNKSGRGENRWEELEALAKRAKDGVMIKPSRPYVALPSTPSSKSKAKSLLTAMTGSNIGSNLSERKARFGQVESDATSDEETAANRSHRIPPSRKTSTAVAISGGIAVVSSGGRTNNSPREASPLLSRAGSRQHFGMEKSPPIGRMAVAQNLDQLDLLEASVPEEGTLLDPVLARRFEEVRLQYASTLLRWRMYFKCAEVMKYCSREVPENFTGKPTRGLGTEGTVTKLAWCSRCDRELDQTSRCAICRRPPLNCAICEMPCFGAMVTCSACTHGGHVTHVYRWFLSQTQCPTGCGCECRVT